MATVSDEGHQICAESGGVEAACTALQVHAGLTTTQKLYPFAQFPPTVVLLRQVDNVMTTWEGIMTSLSNLCHMAPCAHDYVVDLALFLKRIC